MPVDIVCHVDICSFALAVGAKGCVGFSSFGLEVVVAKADSAGVSVATGGDHDDAGVEGCG